MYSYGLPVAPYILWDRTSTIQRGCAWLFEKGCVRIQARILSLLYFKWSWNYSEGMEKNKQTNQKKCKLLLIATHISTFPSSSRPKEGSRESLRHITMYVSLINFWKFLHRVKSETVFLPWIDHFTVVYLAVRPLNRSEAEDDSTVCLITRLFLASLQFKGLVTKHTTGKWIAPNQINWNQAGAYASENFAQNDVFTESSAQCCLVVLDEPRSWFNSCSSSTDSSL